MNPVIEMPRESGAQERPAAAIAHSLEAGRLRAEILAVGTKLWQRQYVDGNGGNISARLGSDFVVCTPTMMSKADMQPADLCVTDLEGNRISGDRKPSSEILLHLEIYKANPLARAVVHCHPPHATAFAVTGSAPPNGFVSEYETFIGLAAVAPYETPGTRAFAETLLPFVEDHNAILLSNHGVVCWAETPTRAEWLVEILDTYCQTVIAARQIGVPMRPIPPEKINELLAIKRRMGLPDPRLKG
ncbi:MAG TPA: class II aldolase/adducin family protein [Terracidiphilus sp.]|nr:class II aldolase/adducin family protein [Terracidiphilus sp.]